MKQGRGRQYNNFGKINEELDYLQELRERAQDLVDDLDQEVRDQEHDNHSIHKLFTHMIQAEVSWFQKLQTQQTSMVPSTIHYLDQFTRAVFSNKSLNDAIKIGPFSSIGEMIRHLQWHWTYHSAQIGLIRRALGHPYKWQFA